MWNSSHTPAGEMETLDCRATPIGLRYSSILGQDVSLLQWLDYSMDPGSSRRSVSKLTHYLSLWKELFQSRQERRASWPPNTHS